MSSDARVTVLDVAHHAGVSRATVSLVLRESPRISEATKKRVRQSIKALGYRYNRSAANLRSARSMAMGLVLADVRDSHFAEVSMAIQEKLDEAGYSLFIGYTLDDLVRQNRLVGSMFERQVDGLMLLPSPGTTAEGLRALFNGENVPHVLIGRRVDDYPFDFVSTDYAEGARKLGDLLSTLRVRHAALLGGYPDSRNVQDRVAGLRAGLDQDVRFDMLTTGFDADAGVRGVAHLLDQGTLPDAIIAYTDTVALGIYDELARRSIVPGRDVAVVGFDESRISTVLRPQLTTVSTSPTAIGREAVLLLLSQLEDPKRPGRTVRIAPELRLTASVPGTAAGSTPGLR